MEKVREEKKKPKKEGSQGRIKKGTKDEKKGKKEGGIQRIWQVRREEMQQERASIRCCLQRNLHKRIWKKEEEG